VGHRANTASVSGGRAGRERLAWRHPSRFGAIELRYRYVPIPQRAASRSKRRTTFDHGGTPPQATAGTRRAPRRHRVSFRALFAPKDTRSGKQQPAPRGTRSGMPGYKVNIRRYAPTRRDPAGSGKFVPGRRRDAVIAQLADSTGTCQYPHTPPRDRSDIRPVTQAVCLGWSPPRHRRRGPYIRPYLIRSHAGATTADRRRRHLYLTRFRSCRVARRGAQRWPRQRAGPPALPRSPTATATSY
jgi:hypothetical protein